MKYLFLAASLMVTSSAYAKSIQLDYDFKFQNQNKSFQVQDNAILIDDGSWTPLGSAQAGVALLGRLTAVSQNAFKIDYMIVDTEKTPVQIRQFAILTPLDNEARMSMEEEDKSKVSINMTFSDVSRDGRAVPCMGRAKVPAAGCEMNAD